MIGYIFFNEIGIRIFELYGYEDPNFLKDKFSTKGGFFSWLGILVTSLQDLRQTCFEFLNY